MSVIHLPSTSVDQSQSLSDTDPLLIIKHNMTVLQLNQDNMRQFIIDAVTDISSGTRKLLLDHLDKMNVKPIVEKLEDVEDNLGETATALHALIVYILTEPTEINKPQLENARLILLDFLSL